MTSQTDAPCADRDPALEWVARHPGPWFALVWAPVLLIAPVIDAAVGGDVLRTLALVVLGVAFAATAWLSFRIGARRHWRTELAFVGLLALSTLYLVLWRTDRQFIFPLLAIAAALAIRQRWALSLISALTISGAVTAGLQSGSLDAALFLGFATFMAGIATFVVQYLVGVVARLTDAQQRLAQTAVAQERLRFSRDLHDLLGHTLSLIVVKAEAVRRLVHSNADAAAEHASDIETIGRTALTDVREAVTGYRSVSLGDELEDARSALAAANVLLSVSPVPGEFGAETDSILGWVVREGSTNVLRHARAAHCSIWVTADDSLARIEIVDDGHTSVSVVEGNGLRGLRERVEQLGGEFSAAATASGFRLEAAVPIGASS